MNAMRTNPEQSSQLFLGYLQVITSQETLTYRLLACLLLKKLFLDDRAEEKECVQLTPEDLMQLRDAIEKSIDMQNDPNNFLRRKAEILCKIHKKLGTYAELIAKLQGLAAQPASADELVLKSKEFAMYMFELLAEFHLP